MTKRYSEHYIGKTIQLYPGDTYNKFGIIKDVDDFGWLIEITESTDTNSYPLGKMFISHSTNFRFHFV